MFRQSDNIYKVAHCILWVSIFLVVSSVTMCSCDLSVSFLGICEKWSITGPTPDLLGHLRQVKIWNVPAYHRATRPNNMGLFTWEFWSAVPLTSWFNYTERDKKLSAPLWLRLRWLVVALVQLPWTWVEHYVNGLVPSRHSFCHRELTTCAPACCSYFNCLPYPALACLLIAVYFSKHSQVFAMAIISQIADVFLSPPPIYPNTVLISLTAGHQ